MPTSHSTVNFTTVAFDETNNTITVLDQTCLPNEEKYVTLTTVDEVFSAIRTMQIRGAPLIGVTAAYGIALVAHNRDRSRVIAAADHLATARPTAVNLIWAVSRMKEKLETEDNMRTALIKEARTIEQEDKDACQRIGEYGSTLIPDTATLMVHCNAGALATSGIGTALGIVYTAASQGKKIRVIANETRPLLQGARLTAWELTRNNIHTCVICDAMAGVYMDTVSAILVGADRIAVNGDTANKIGTYTLAILAAYFRVPLYVAAPLSSFDPDCMTGADIPIEQRDENEIRTFNNLSMTPEKAQVANPAFDVTPANLITAIITEHGIIKPPYSQTIPSLVNRCNKEKV